MEMQLQSIRGNLISILYLDYAGLMITEKIENWPELSWHQFTEELYLQGIKLELSTKRNWEMLFLSEKDRYQTIKRELFKVENLIDLRNYLKI